MPREFIIVMAETRALAIERIDNVSTRVKLSFRIITLCTVIIVFVLTRMKKAHTKLDERVSFTILSGSSRLMIAVARAKHHLLVLHSDRTAITTCPRLLRMGHP